MELDKLIEVSRDLEINLGANVYAICFLFGTIMVMATIVMIFACISARKLDYFLFFFMGLSAFFIIGGMSSLSYANDLEEEKAELLQQFIEKDRDTIEVKVTDIINVEALSDSRCLEVRENETCYLVDIVAEGDITQVFMSLEGSISSQGDSQITMKVVDFTEKEEEFISNHLRLQNIKNEQSKRLVKVGAWGILAREEITK